MSWANKTLYLTMIKGSPDFTNWLQMNLFSLSPSSSRTGLLSLAVFLWIWLVLIVQSRKSSRKIEIPFVSYFPVPVPNVISGLYTLYRLQNDGLAFAEKLVSKYGSLLRLPVGLETIYLVADASVAQKILSSSDPTTLNRPRHILENIFLHEYRDGLLVLDYDIWSSHRKVIAQSFTYNSLQSYLHSMNGHAKNLTKKLLSLCSLQSENSVQGKLVEDLIWSETIKIILETVMGSDCCTDEESMIVHNSFKRGKRIVQYRLQNPYLFLPPIWWLHPKRAELNKIVPTLQDFFTQKIQKFRQSTKVGSDSEGNPTVGNSDEHSDSEQVSEKKTAQQKCMIENMISAGASDKEVFAEIGTLVTAGHETTATAINMLLFHLACNPECQSLCRDEVLRIWGSGEKFCPRVSGILEMKYLERCILESLRLTPTVPFFFKRLDASFKVDEKLRLEKGKTVVLSPWNIHHNPTTYPDPKKFDPDRFLAENVQKRHAYSFLPFSAGPRNCIGYKYAMLEMKVIMAWLIHHFDISTSDDPKTVRYFMEITVMPDRELNIILKKKVSCFGDSKQN